MATLLKINLLPATARQPSLSVVEQLVRMPLARVGAAGMVALTLLVGGVVVVQGGRLVQLQVKIKVLEPKKAEIDQLQQFIRQLHAQEAVFKSLQSDERHRWSMRLQELSEATPEGVWYIEFEMDQGKGLVIRGTALGEGSNQTVRVNQLVEELKGQPKFSAAIKDLQIESVKAAEDGDISLAQFVLTGGFAKSEEP